MARSGPLLTEAQWNKIAPSLHKLPKQHKGGRPKTASREIFCGRTISRKAETPRNDDSLALRLTDGAELFLLAGDIEGPSERKILSEEQVVGVNFLKVAHHGSKTSTTEPFFWHLSESKVNYLERTSSVGFSLWGRVFAMTNSTLCYCRSMRIQRIAIATTKPMAASYSRFWR
jgi:hypothetical protein